MNIDKFKGKRILVLGDVGIDQYFFGTATRISPEAPAPVLNDVREENRLGLAANVAANIQALGGIPTLISVVSNDETGNQFQNLLESHGIDNRCIITETGRLTTGKTRIMAGSTQLVRLDEESTHNISYQTESKLIEILMKKLPYADAIIIQDYGKGVVTRQLAETLIALALPDQKVLIDPYSKQDPSVYWDADVITPNKQECMELTSKFHPGSVKDATRLLRNSTNAPLVVTTLGKDGMYALGPEGKEFNLDAKAETVLDVTGAGDTVISVLALAAASGMKVKPSMKLANEAAGIVVKKLGTSVCTFDELQKAVTNI